jgi:hypothetical protein
MPNLVGIGNEQVPTNGMLGGMAYQTTDNVLIKGAEIENISPILTKLADAASSIYIYDTSNDSDGGAWRKRTQNASWYNEGPSRHRGTRKEFPSIAVIVAEERKLTIYDGDDPNLPMWMIFIPAGYGTSAGNIIQSGAGGNPGNLTIRDVHMLNGQLVVVQNQGSDSYGSPVINFISERVERMDPNSGESGRWHGNISQRNTKQEYDHIGGYGIANSQMYCCTQFVDDNAKIDKDSGLPRPTIFVGHNAGVSQIHSDETVDTDGSPPGGAYNCVAMTDANFKNEVVCVFRSGNVIVTYMYELQDKVDPGNVRDQLKHYYYNGAMNTWPSIRWHPGSDRACWVDDDTLALSNHVGISLYMAQTAANNGTTNAEYRDNTSGGTRTYAYLNKDYPTGYLRRNNPVCTCASKSTDSLAQSSNLISNGEFTSNITGWNDLSGSGSSISHNSGNSRMDLNGAVNYARAHTTITTEVGVWYMVYTKPLSVSPNVFGSNQELNVWVGTAQYPSTGYNHLGMGRYKHGVTDVNEPITVTFRATQTTTHIVLESGWNVAADNVYAVRAAEDVSSNNGQLNPGGSSFSVNGQQLHKGFVARNTIGRTPAATNSEIVLYDFSSQGYLEQPYNHQLNFLENTGNSYTAMAWGSTIGGSSWKPLIARDYWNGSKQWYLGVHDRMALHGGVVGDTDIEAGQLYFFCWVRNGTTGTNYVYLNGELDGSNSDGGGGAAIRQTLVIGGRHANSQTSENTGGSITDNNRWTGAALVRISQGYTDADMIRRIYNEERKLFMPNAKCTLDRDSNLIRGVSYDKSTGLLHVLSNASRNDFDGLVRINSVARNSSGTLGNRPISSAKGMIVEES